MSLSVRKTTNVSSLGAVMMSGGAKERGAIMFSADKEQVYHNTVKVFSKMKCTFFIGEAEDYSCNSDSKHHIWFKK